MTLVLQGLVLIIIIGVVYSLWQTTKSYGGVIGSALKWIGVGILFFTVEALDRIFGTLANVSFVNTISIAEPAVLHNLLLLFGLLFSGIGFSKLTRAAK